jgi:hypothetical protein
MRALFILLGCPLCNRVEEVIINVNKSLPIGQQIRIVDVFSGDPLLSYLAQLYESPDPYEWAVPVCVFDNPKVHVYFGEKHKVEEIKGTFRKEQGSRIMLNTIWDYDHYYTLIKHLLQGAY